MQAYELALQYWKTSRFIIYHQGQYLNYTENISSWGTILWVVVSNGGLLLFHYSQSHTSEDWLSLIHLAIVEGRRHMITLCLLEPTHIDVSCVLVITQFYPKFFISFPFPHSVPFSASQQRGDHALLFFIRINYMTCLDQWIWINRMQGKFRLNSHLFFRALGHCHQNIPRLAWWEAHSCPSWQTSDIQIFVSTVQNQHSHLAKSHYSPNIWRQIDWMTLKHHGCLLNCLFWQ